MKMKLILLAMGVLLLCGCPTGKTLPADIGSTEDVAPKPEGGVKPDGSQKDMIGKDAGQPDSVAKNDGPSPDVAKPDMAAPDLKASDMAAPDLKIPDMAAPDQKIPDMPHVDSTVPDAPALDAAVPDVSGVPDMPIADQLQPDLVKLVGYEGGPCFPNKTCFSGFVCISGLCKNVPDAGKMDHSILDISTFDILPQDTMLPDLAQPDVQNSDSLIQDMAVDLGLCTGCRISGNCYSSGVINTGNKCEKCDPTASMNSWTLFENSGCVTTLAGNGKKGSSE